MTTTTPQTTIARLALLAAALLAATTLAVADGELRFIQKGDMFDLSELSDGETRTFGDGDHRIIATRDGDTVRVTRDPGADGRPLDLACDVAQDTCKVMTAPDDEHVMISVEKRRSCVGDDCGTIDLDVTAFAGGDASVLATHGGLRKMVIQRGGECDHGNDDCNSWVTDAGDGEVHVIVEQECDESDDDCGAWVTGAGAGDVQVLVERIECVDDGDGEECETFTWHGDGDHGMPSGVIPLPMPHGAHAGSMVFIDEGGHATVLGGSDVLLSCPEGDARIHVEKDEADDTFLCPKHSVPMEQVKRKVMPHGPKRRVKIERR